MKQHIYSGGFAWLLLLCAGLTGFGQSNFKHQFKAGKKSNLRFAGPPHIATHGVQPNHNTQSLWDLRFLFDNITEESGLTSSAGVVFSKSRFIVSKWNAADSVAVFDSLGVFLQKRRITNAGAIRSMTTDGNFIYAGNNSANIQVINPTTLTRVRQMAVPGTVGAVRWITYNPAGNNGAGSFFVGNFDTDIFEITKPATGAATLLNTIPATNHGLTGMYGVAYQSAGANSKFWVYNQADPLGGESGAVIVVLDANGMQTGMQHDTQIEFANTDGLAGGIGIANIGGFEGPTLYGLMQGVGIVGYDIALLNFDAAVDSLAISNKMGAWPKDLKYAPNFNYRVRSVGQSDLTGVNPKVVLQNAFSGTTVQEMAGTVGTIAAGASMRLSTPRIDSSLYDIGTYVASGVVQYTGDQNAENDTIAAIFAITDSTMAKDYAFIIPELAGRVGIGAGANEEKSVGVRYSTPLPTYITSVSYFLQAPSADQQSSASIFPIENNIISTTPMATTPTYTTTQEDAENGVRVTLNFAQPVLMPAGEFVVAVNELGDSTLGIGFTSNIWDPGTFFVKWTSNNGGAWTDIGSFGGNFKKALAVYPNFGLGFQIPASIPFALSSATNSSVCAGNTIRVGFNAASGTTFLPGNVFKLEISDASGQFGNATEIGSLQGTSSDSITGTIPSSFAGGTGYKLRVTSTKPLRSSIEIVNAPVINALPMAPGTISGSSNFCPNEGNKLYQVAPMAGATAYTWTVPAGASITSNPDSNAVFVQFATTGGQITAAAVNECGTGSTSTKAVQQTVVLPAVVTAFTPSATICQGANAPFIANIQNGGTSPSYQWLLNGNPIANATTSSYSTTSLNNGDKISVVLTSSITCGEPNIDTSTAITMTVNQPQTPSAAITSNATNNTACQGTAVLFSSTVQNGGGTAPQYQWFKNATAVIGGTQLTLSINTLTATDSIRLRYSVSGNCLTTNQVFSNWIYTNILPVSAVSYTVVANTLTTVATGAVSYQWFLNNNEITGATNADYTIEQTGVYCVEVTFANGCKNKSACNNQVYVSVVSELKDKDFTIFPNPAKNELSVSWSQAPVSEIAVWNALGQKVLTQSVGLQTQSQMLNISHLAAGMYRVVGTTSDGRTATRNFVKQ